MVSRTARDNRLLVVLSLAILLLVGLNRDSEYVREPDENQRILHWHKGALALGFMEYGEVSADYPPHIAPLLFERITVNSADAQLLQTIPGIGKTLAQRIVTERRVSGPYRQPSDLMRVVGIGAIRSEKLVDHLRFD